MEMALLYDGVIAFLAAVGLSALMWLLAGALLHRRSRTVRAAVVLPVRDSAEEMEDDVRLLLGEYDPTGRGLPVLIADCGLTQEAAARAEILARSDHRIAVVLPQEILNFFA
ncbi:MAG: hypothetical protein J6J83_05485 [Oscillospiraceae bacterium]|nr:hypothetical protein [Oscillospiraceae bacterium]